MITNITDLLVVIGIGFVMLGIIIVVALFMKVVDDIKELKNKY